MFDLNKRNDDPTLASIPVKANKLLYLLLSVILLIVLRIWHLGAIQHEKKVEEAFRPRRKVVIEAPERGTIRDRFNNLLAANAMEYRLSIIYSHLREIPAFAFEIDSKGEKKKRSLRREYIKALAKKIGEEIQVDCARIEDLIHSHASLYDHIPLVIKTGLTEEQYYRLKFVEKDFPGIFVERIPKRYYPYGRVASHIIGYLGPIQKEGHERQLKQIRALSEYIEQVESGIDVDLLEGITSLSEAKRKLAALREQAYAMNDDVGIFGIEAQFEEQLRGYLGKKIYFSDAKGNFVRSMPGARPPIPGKRLLLSVSIELQEFAEKLLAKSEFDREKAGVQRKKKEGEPLKDPWVRGGAIVAIDPNTGEVIALASSPRFDPNDFVKRKSKLVETKLEEDSSNSVLRWIENEAFIAKVWDQRMPLSRELAQSTSGVPYDDEMWLSWRNYLQLLLPYSSPMIAFLAEECSVAQAVAAQKSFDEILKRAPNVSPQEIINLLYSGPVHDELPLKLGSLAEFQEKDRESFLSDIGGHKATLDGFLSGYQDNGEKLLLLDLTKVVLCQEDFSEELLEVVGSLSLSDFRELSSAHALAQDFLRRETRKVFHDNDFKKWRQEHEKSFLRAKRLEEKREKKQVRPYLDYLDKLEKEQFKVFWQKIEAPLVDFFFTTRISISQEERASLLPYLASFSSLPSITDEKLVILKKRLLTFEPELVGLFLRSLKSFDSLNHTLYGAYLRAKGKTPLARDLAMAFTKSYSDGPLRSHAFRQTTIQGSIFKLVTAYAGLKQRYQELHGKVIPQDLSLFEIDDHFFKSAGRAFVGKQANGTPIPQLYKGGRIPKSLHHHLGKLNLLQAIATSSNPYFSLLAGDYLKDPKDLVQAAKDFGYGEKSLLLIPGEIAGNVPSDLQENRTGLYATAIGQHTLVTTPLQTALMLSAIANGGKLLEPKIASLLIGKNLPFEKNTFHVKKNFHLRRSMQAIGIDFPLFLQATPQDVKNEVYEFPTHVRRTLFFPDPIRATLLEGMRRSVRRSQDEARARPRQFQQQRDGYKELLDLQGQFVGKTSTAEVIEKVGLDLLSPSKMYRHIWFGGISFAPSTSNTEARAFTFKDQFGKPELVVVVYLRYGGYGKDASPIAAQVVQKYRELCR